MIGSRETYDLVAEKFGTRWARISLGILLAAALVAAISAIATFIYYIHVYAIRRLLALTPAVPQSTVLTTTLSVGASSAIVGLITWTIYRRRKGWEQRVGGLLQEYFDAQDDNRRALERRIGELEKTTASLESVNKALSDIHSRLSAIEPLPLDISSILPGTDPKDQEEELKRHVLMKLLDAPRAKAPSDKDVRLRQP